MSDPVLRVENLVLGYHDHVAVDNLTLSVDKGEFVHVAGRNGSGKSSFVKAVLGLLDPWSGTARLAVPRDRVGYLAQGEGQDPSFPATVFEVALAGRQRTGKLLPFYTGRDREETRLALADMGMADMAGRRIGELSGGQRRRALIARALARNPELLILDEPLSGLDRDSGEGLLALLDRRNRENGLTVVMTTHALDLARPDSRVLLLDGKPLYDGPASGMPDSARGGH